MADNYEYYEEETAKPASPPPPPPPASPPKSPAPSEPAPGQDYDYYYDENNPAHPPGAAPHDAASVKPAQSAAGSPAPSAKPTAAESPAVSPKPSAKPGTDSNAAISPVPSAKPGATDSHAGTAAPATAPSVGKTGAVDSHGTLHSAAPSAKPQAPEGGGPASPLASPKTSIKPTESPAMSPKASPMTQPPTAAASPTMLPKSSPAGSADASSAPGRDMTTLFLFDVDGTITPLKGNISNEMIEFLKKLMQKVPVGVISGSDTKKLSEQLRSTEDAIDYVCAENGTYYRKKGEKPVTTSIYEKLGNDKMKKFMDYVLDYMSKLQIPAKKGNFIETRNNMINISPVGRTANDKEREEFKAYDKENSVRRKFVSELGAKFKDYDLSYNIAGDISFDVYPKGWDKSFCLSLLEKEHFKTIHFFGDKVNKGENDYEIYHDKRVIGHRVSGPEDTKKQVSELLHL